MAGLIAGLKRRLPNQDYERAGLTWVQQVRRDRSFHIVIVRTQRQTALTDRAGRFAAFTGMAGAAICTRRPRRCMCLNWSGTVCSRGRRAVMASVPGPARSPTDPRRDRAPEVARPAAACRRHC